MWQNTSTKNVLFAVNETKTRAEQKKTEIEFVDIYHSATRTPTSSYAVPLFYFSWLRVDESRV